MPARNIAYADAIREALDQEMERDARVFIMGQGVGDHRGTNGSTLGLLQKYGPDRVQDTPLSEEGMTGAAIGAALAGLRPVHVHIRMDFLLLAMNQLVNVAAKSRYMYGGTVRVPLVVRALVGRSWGQGPQHSQALHSLFMHVPGIKVVAPSTPHDARGLLAASIRDDNPVLFMEHRLLYSHAGPVPDEPYTLPLGKASIRRAGTDITLVGISHMALESERACWLLERRGINAEMIDPMTLSPLDIDTIAASVEKTGRLLVVDGAWTCCGAGAEIVTQTLEKLQGKRSFQAARLGFQSTPCPTSHALERLFYPNPDSIAAAAQALICGGSQHAWASASPPGPEIAGFKGPF